MILFCWKAVLAFCRRVKKITFEPNFVALPCLRVSRVFLFPNRSLAFIWQNFISHPQMFIFNKQIIYLYLWALKNNCGAEFFFQAMFGYLRVLLYCVTLGQCVTHNINCRLYGNDLCHKKLPLFKRMHIFHLLRWLHQPIFHVQIKIRGASLLHACL